MCGFFYYYGKIFDRSYLEKKNLLCFIVLKVIVYYGGKSIVFWFSGFILGVCGECFLYRSGLEGREVGIGYYVYINRFFSSWGLGVCGGIFYI